MKMILKTFWSTVVNVGGPSRLGNHQGGQESLVLDHLYDALHGTYYYL